jgi:S-formylglutathione hydrolase FrmB
LQAPQPEAHGVSPWIDPKDVIAGAGTNPGPFVSQPLWLDAGDSDPFQPGDQAFTAALQADGANLTTKTWPGGHESDYWNSHWASYLRFYADALQGCGE